MSTHDATKSSRPSWKTRFRPNTSPSEPDVTMTAAPQASRRSPPTAACRPDGPVSSLMAGSRMLTAEVLALTTRVDKQVAARTPLARDVLRASVILDPRVRFTRR